MSHHRRLSSPESDEAGAARRFFAGLSEQERWELGDQLVLGTFEPLDWFEKRPSAAFMRALDYERMLWEG